MSEGLTEKEREAILNSVPIGFPGCHYVGKLLRIHDAQAAALDRVRAHVRSSGGSCQGEVILRLASTEPGKPEAT